ncbi:MMPL family transporter [Cellulomonas soli]|uniref:Membrane protein n=1 Tax=Cellulomonas soli TaxID=931535 RepID=A0A512PGA0_9CELL|nr:MMPL family transporter [Cellulomonas soli]NYI58089.1 RND superfamily putative drug exporter [Cellulomonas soli]GEP70224.1 membrane protein [Cellulomonas soli]
MPVKALARFSARHPLAVVVAWVLLAAGLTLAVRWAGPGLDQVISVPGSDSAAAADVLQAFDADEDEATVTSTVIVATDGPVVDQQDEVATFATRLRAVDGVLEVTDPLTADPVVTTPDGRAVVLEVRTDAAVSVDGVALRAAVDDARAAGLQVGASAPLVREVEPPGLTRTSELIGVVVAIVVLLLTLRSFTAAAIPLVNALVSVAAGLAVLHLVGQVVAIPEIAPTLATMIGLGVGIDYALFQVARHRTVLSDAPNGPRSGPSAGVPADPSAAPTAWSFAETTAGTTGRAVAFAGITVALAVCALAITGVDFVAWLGLGTAVVVLVVLLASLMLTPALLALAGRRVLPRGGADDGDAHTGAGWARFARRVTARPVRWGVASVLVLGVLAAPALSLRLGEGSDGDRPVGTERRTTYDLMVAHRGPGASSPLTLVVALDPAATTPEDPRLLAVAAEAAQVDGVQQVGALRLDPSGAAARATVVTTQEAGSEQRPLVLADLRAIDPPTGSEVHVGGISAIVADLSDRIAARLPWLILGTVLLAALLLVVAFRSLLVPLKAALMDLVSVAAAYGVVVAVFQWGWGAHLLGLDGPVTIESHVPMMLFAVLFGLSMDYEVFLLSAVHEARTAGADAREAVVRGVGATARVITAAAVVMFAVFASFVLVDDPTIKMFGVGLAVAVLVDATLVRVVLGPAVMACMGERAWWFPARLGRLVPHVDL